MPRLAAFPADATVRLDGTPYPAREGEPLAAALLAAGITTLGRSPKYHRARGAFCLSGSCAGCLLRVDGLPSLRACRIPCREGLSGETQNAFPDARHDLLGVVDLATPRGLDHHHLGTSSALAARAAVALSRRLSGVGRAPDAVASSPAPPPPAEEEVDALIVGAGPAGLAAAEALAEAGRTVLVAEGAPVAGGRLRARLGARGDPDLSWAASVTARLSTKGGEVACGVEVVGLWHDGGAPLALLHTEGPPARVRLARPRVIVLCPGGHPIPPALPGGDRPGVLAARGVATLLAEHGVLPGARVAVLGAGPDAEGLAAALAAADTPAELVAPAEAASGRLSGRARVHALVLPGRRISCDTVAVTGAAPALELGRALGAPVRWDPALGALALAVNPRGETGVGGLFAAGEVCGAASAAAAAEAGRRAGEAARG
jgi:sarcosine oxidase subunit alpha